MVLYDPDDRLPVSRETGFLGTPGDNGLGELMDPDRDDFFADVWDPETRRLSSSREVGFLGNSGEVGLTKFPEVIRDDLAGVAGLLIDDCLAGILVIVHTSGCLLVLEGSGQEGTCSGFSNGTAVLVVIAFSLVCSIATEVCFGALLFGPRARTLVMCCSSGAGPDLSSCADWVGDMSASALGVDVLFAMGGGPRASIPANPGSNRPASLPDRAGVLAANRGAG